MSEKQIIPVGQNVHYHIDGSKLVIEVDLSKTQGLTAKGTSTRVASTLGTTKVPYKDEIILVGLNVTKK